MTPSTNDQAIEQLVNKIAPGSRFLRAWPLPGGISASMTAFEMQYPDGRKEKRIVRLPGAATLKHNPSAARDEFKLLQILHALGLAVPAPFYLDSGSHIFATPCLVIEYIEGRPQFSPADLGNFTLLAAAQMARIHRLDVSHLDLSFLPQQPPKFVASPGKHSEKMDTSLSEARICQFLESAWPLTPLNAPVLLHGDFWPGNFLWQGDRLAAVIDWEDAALGDPLFDLAISRLDFLWIFGKDAMETFTHQYQSRMTPDRPEQRDPGDIRLERQIDFSNLPYYDLYAALRLVRLAGSVLAAWAAFFVPFGRADITEQSIRNDYHFFIKQAFDKLTR